MLPLLIGILVGNLAEPVPSPDIVEVKVISKLLEFDNSVWYPFSCCKLLIHEGQRRIPKTRFRAELKRLPGKLLVLKCT